MQQAQREKLLKQGNLREVLDKLEMLQTLDVLDITSFVANYKVYSIRPEDGEYIVRRSLDIHKNITGNIQCTSFFLARTSELSSALLYVARDARCFDILMFNEISSYFEYITQNQDQIIAASQTKGLDVLLVKHKTPV